MTRYGTVLHLSEGWTVEQAKAMRDACVDLFADELAGSGKRPRPDTARLFFVDRGTDGFMDCALRRPCDAAHYGVSMEADG